MDYKEDFPAKPRLKRNRACPIRKKINSLIDDNDTEFLNKCIACFSFKSEDCSCSPCATCHFHNFPKCFFLKPHKILRYLLDDGYIPPNFLLSLDSIHIDNDQQRVFIDFLKCLQ